MLAMYSGQIGSFSSRDLLLFFIMWELEFIPVYLLLSGKKRLYSATNIGNNTLFWFSYCLCCQIADDTPTYMVTRYPRGSTLQYMYAFSWNIMKDGSIWIDSDQYGIISSRSF
ncbi:hypothetical protein IEQ34_025376 [Dendrobium chrysotoxum]|nr:hypothetical protein IEQ34_025376 [Dendrobium chrysotoxum]